MITNTTQEEDQTASEEMRFSSVGKLSSVSSALQARWTGHVQAKADRRLKKTAELAVAQSNKHYEEIEELKYYLTQRHRMAVAAWHSRPEVERINKAFFTAMEEVAEIENGALTGEQKVVRQRMALKRGKRAIQDVVGGAGLG